MVVAGDRFSSRRSADQLLARGGRAYGIGLGECLVGNNVAAHFRLELGESSNWKGRRAPSVASCRAAARKMRK